MMTFGDYFYLEIMNLRAKKDILLDKISAEKFFIFIHIGTSAMLLLLGTTFSTFDLVRDEYHVLNIITKVFGFISFLVLIPQVYGIINSIRTIKDLKQKAEGCDAEIEVRRNHPLFGINSKVDFEKGMP